MRKVTLWIEIGRETLVRRIARIVVVGSFLSSALLQGCGGEETDPRVAACQVPMVEANTCGH